MDSQRSDHTVGSAARRSIRSAYKISRIDRQSLVASVDTGLTRYRIKSILDATIDDNLVAFLASLQLSNKTSTASIRFGHGFTPLIVASKYNAVNIVHWICQNDKAVLECKDAHGNTALHHAVANRNASCVLALLEAHVHTDTQNAEGATSLHFAAYHGYKGCVGHLVSAGTPAINIRDNTGKTSLMLAAFRGRTKAVSTLLEAGAKVNEQDDAGWTALMYAAFTGRVAICRELLEFLATRTVVDYKRLMTAADLAQEAGYYEVADMLQNKEVETRTPSLPEGMYMPRFRPASCTLVSNPSTSGSPVHAQQHHQQHHQQQQQQQQQQKQKQGSVHLSVIERPLSPPQSQSQSHSQTNPVRSNKSQYSAHSSTGHSSKKLLLPIPPPPLIQSPRHISYKKDIPKSHHTHLHHSTSLHTQELDGLNIVIPGLQPKSTATPRTQMSSGIPPKPSAAAFGVSSVQSRQKTPYVFSMATITESPATCKKSKNSVSETPLSKRSGGTHAISTKSTEPSAIHSTSGLKTSHTTPLPKTAQSVSKPTSTHLSVGCKSVKGSVCKNNNAPSVHASNKPTLSANPTPPARPPLSAKPTPPARPTLSAKSTPPARPVPPARPTPPAHSKTLPSAPLKSIHSINTHSQRKSSPLHTPITIEQSRNGGMQPGSGWSERQTPIPKISSNIYPTPSFQVPLSSGLESSKISERIRDTVSRASLKYLDSRTKKALKHDSAHHQIVTSTTAMPKALDPCDSPDIHVTNNQSSAFDMKYTKLGSAQRRKVAVAARKNLGLTRPFKRYHDSSRIWPYWRAFSILVTLWMPNVVLKKLLRKETSEKCQAWREKIALCFIIVLITGLTALISFGLSTMFCHPIDPISLQNLSEKHGADAREKLTVIRGMIYDVSNSTQAALLNLTPQQYGHDSSSMFAPFPEESAKCKHWPKGKSAQSCYSVLGDSTQCMSSNETLNVLKTLRTNKWVVYQWNDILYRTNNSDSLFVYNEKVYSLKPYLLHIQATADQDEYFGKDLTKLLKGLVGTDASIAVSRSSELQELVPCWESQLRLGRVEGSTVGCIITSGITISITVILNIMILIKLLCAVLFDWAFSLQLTKITKHFTRGSAKRVPHVLITVTCYNEGEDTLRATLDSVAMTNYACSRKILFIIADGEVEASGDEIRTTPQILRGLIQRTNPNEPTSPLPYIAIGEGPREFNAAEVTSGSYTSHNGIVVPCILIVKVGTKWERDNDMPKAGNRGKRDSQLIILQWLRNVLMNDHLTPLEFELCRAASQLAKINPDQFEYLLMMDADTAIDIECIPRLVAAMERDPGIMGLCGETRVANKRESWVTRIQVYEYYISHHLSKAFESLWGGVTCLPGCCSMYRIYSRKDQSGSLVPLLVAPEVIDAYSSNETSTLHQKNLLLLGEDRYLTTVLLRAFPKRKLIYVPRAICRTTVPNKFSVLISQRRRWINSTIHNLLELVLVRDLCGTFCCSMQFLVLMDLLGNVVLPSSVIFFFYLIIAACIGQPVAMPLLLMAFAFGLQGLMILITTQRISYIYWMVIYIAAIPLWNFVMPVYAFWRFDDFSWGKTRMAYPEDGKAEFITHDERMALEPIPLMRWKDWMRDNLESGYEQGHAQNQNQNQNRNMA